MADWEKIKTEYVTTQCTQKYLADKYGVSRSHISHRAIDEGWTEQRSKHSAEVAQKVSSSVASHKASRAQKIMEASDRAIEKVTAYIAGINPEEASGTDLNAVANALKKLQEIQGIKSEADKAEQDARIAILRRQADPATGLDGQRYGVVMLPPIEPLKPPDGETDG